MPPRSLINRLNGFYELEETRQRSEWERARWAAAVNLSIYAKKGQRIKPQDLAVFPWEKEATPRIEINPELVAQRWAKWDEDVKNGK